MHIPAAKEHYDRPDFKLKKLKTGEVFGVENVVPYISNRSVPGRHKKSGLLNIPYEEGEIKKYL